MSHSADGDVGLEDAAAGGLGPIRLVAAMLLCCAARTAGAEPATKPATKPATEPGAAAVAPLWKTYCHDCHGDGTTEGDVDLAASASLESMRRDVRLWQRVAEMVATGQMPPPEAPQPAAAERAAMHDWLRAFLAAEARAHAGDPGRVVLRRLNNAEYTFTIRDLTGVDTLDPAREFPVDGGAGEGFTNTGQSLVMSPALVTKYLDAAKEVATHMVPLPDGIRFSAGSSRRDFADEALERIRGFYHRFSRPLAGSLAAGQATVKQGITLDMGRDGFLPVEDYLAATFAVRDAVGAAGSDAAPPIAPPIARVARDRGLSAKYLGTLWHALTVDDGRGSRLLDGLRARWAAATAADSGRLATEIRGWQEALWKFNAVGQIGRHLGRPDGPASWLEAVTPLEPRHEVRLDLSAPAEDEHVTVRLAATDAGDGGDDDVVVWENPRLVAQGRPDVPLRSIRRIVASRRSLARRIAPTAAACLAAAAEALAAERPPTPEAGRAAVDALARKHAVDPRLLTGWLDMLGIGGPPTAFESLLATKQEAFDGYDFLKAWTGPDDLTVRANSSADTVRVPGTMKPHGITVHPAKKRRVLVGWKSPVTATVRVEATVQRAHIGCGNGVTWSLECWRGGIRQRLAGGTLDNGKAAVAGPVGPLALRRGDSVVLAVGARDAHHTCDTTAVDLTIRTGAPDAPGEPAWDLARDVSGDLLAANPHADTRDNDAVWHFASEADVADSGATIPAGSLLDRWQAATAAAERTALAADVQRLLEAAPAAAAPSPAAATATPTAANPAEPAANAAASPATNDGATVVAESPADAALRRTLLSLGGPLLATIDDAPGTVALDGGNDDASAADDVGLDPAAFGTHPRGLPVADGDLCMRAPGAITVRIPAALAAGRALVAAATVHPQAPGDVSFQPQVRLAGTDPDAAGLSPALPVVAAKHSPAWNRFARAFADFRDLFPRAVCYARIVPVDEVVTLNVYYREDDHLRRLMLDDAAAAELDRLWDELLFISHEPLELADAHEQLLGYASQDRGDLTGPLGAMRPFIAARAASFRDRLRVAEPAQLDAVVALAERAYRRPLRAEESRRLRELHAVLRQDDLPPEEALALLLARVLVSSEFLYKGETPPPGTRPRPVTGHELASRLSSFLWSSLPDAELLEAAAAGRLDDAAGAVAQARRMLRDPQARRLAAEFGTQWLHVHGFAAHDEKSVEAFPTFASLRGAMEEETILFLADVFQHDRSILSLLDADHTFLNEELARHYGIAGVEGPDWRRVDGVRQAGRGGILGLATTLATQSGASRTSPILRGNWTSEVLLGEKLPKPPKNVPLLADTVPAGLTERQLIALHSSNEACAKCHARIDPYGFALEHFDAIGRYRTHDAAGHPIDAGTRLADGTVIDGHEGLRRHLLTVRRGSFVRQFCRKLLGYALGRAVQLSDEPLLDEIEARLAAEGHRMHVAIEAIVASPQFRTIRGADAADEGE